MGQDALDATREALREALEPMGDGMWCLDNDPDAVADAVLLAALVAAGPAPGVSDT